ncbi:hypothetical protein EG327_007488 [Venturia inaequalis]|uniref:Uncharacterized protein n=1 Tax=Venturia inaequalis TaxID=5025 RepID=A0A8H3ZI72_VENIN|nr:hypothetical protein EG327_007488 [Venturia inaequalis]
MQKRASTDGMPEHNKENAAAAEQDLRQLITSHVRFLLTESHKIITSQDVFLAAVEMPVSWYANFTFGFHNSFPHPYDYVLGAFLHLSVNSLYHEAVSTFNNIRPIHIRPSGGDCLVRYLAVLVAICFAWIIDQLSGERTQLESRIIMSPEMTAIVNEWQARKQQIQRRQLNDPNYEPRSHEFDPVILEPNFFQRHPYMRQTATMTKIQKQKPITNMASTSPSSQNEHDNPSPHPRVHDHDEKPKVVHIDPVNFRALLLIYYSVLIGSCIVEFFGLHEALRLYCLCGATFEVLQPSDFSLGVMAGFLLQFVLCYVLKLAF